MSENTKRFDEYQVECTECEHYWDNSCDGVKCFEEKHCTSYKATKRMEIPKEIDKVKKDIKAIDRNQLLFALALLLHLISEYIWG